ncbi:hypothetical protein EYF80_043070 [Liparis tanakae]|uniref:Uncharacterized protein n=1 Tax=Liparis tanakae TaxID=230148 RepID=A0A4Z2G0C6_9TELE|nr:hypothetical protein EYF80_043070 [Liparis tanakae]
MVGVAGLSPSKGSDELSLLRTLRLRRPSTARAPPWDLSVVLDSLCSPPFEPLAETELRWLVGNDRFSPCHQFSRQKMSFTHWGTTMWWY